MCLKMPRLAPPLVPWLLPSIDSPFGVSKNGSAAALSGGVPGLDADWAVPCEPRHRRREREAHRAPWPSWETRPPSFPISSHSQAHLLDVESFTPSSSDRSSTVVSLGRTTFAAEALNCLSYRFFSLGHLEHLSLLTWCPIHHTHSTILLGSRPSAT